MKNLVDLKDLEVEDIKRVAHINHQKEAELN